MPKVELDKNKNVLENKIKMFESQNYDKYIPCLLSHYVELISALQADDIEAIFKVFKECRVPAKFWCEMSRLLKIAYDSDFQAWVVGP
jgi:hypothetical protein